MTEIVHGGSAFRHSEPVLPRWAQTLDHWTVAALMVLFLIGVVLGFASSPPFAERHGQSPFMFVHKQVVFGLASLAVMLLISMLETKWARRLGCIAFAASFLGLLLLPVFGTDYGKGAVRWFSLGFGSVQPSEFLKPGFVVFTAWLMAGSMGHDRLPGRSISLLVALVTVILLVIQPDFGQASLVIFSWCVLFFVSGAPILPLVGIAALTVLAGYGAYSYSEHFARRVDAFLAGEVAPYSQLEYSMDAIREGGMLGVGVGEGTVKWSLPDGHTDFIVAVAAEEYGLGMVLIIILLFIFVCVRSLKRLFRQSDPFSRLAGTGLISLFTIQAVINLGVSVGMLPAKGLTLPFISYGGSSLFAIGLTMGILLACTRDRSDPGSEGSWQGFRT